MATLQIELEPQVSAALQKRAAADGLGLSEYVGGVLTEFASKDNNARTVSRLKGRQSRANVSTGAILEALQAGRK